MLRPILFTTLLLTALLSVARADDASDDAAWAKRCESLKQRGISIPECSLDSNGASDHSGDDRSEDGDDASSSRRSQGRGRDAESSRNKALKVLTDAINNADASATDKSDFTAAYAPLKTAKFKEVSMEECNQAPTSPSIPVSKVGAASNSTPKAPIDNTIIICGGRYGDSILLHEAGDLMGRSECEADSLTTKALFYGAKIIFRGTYDEECPANIDLEDQLLEQLRDINRRGDPQRNRN